MLHRYRDGVGARGVDRPRVASRVRRAAGRGVAGCSTGPSSRARSTLIWQRVRRLNRYVEERAPWQLARDRDAAAGSTRRSRSLAEGLRVVSVLLHPYMPASDRRSCSTRSARPTSTTTGAAFAGRGTRCAPSSARAAVPQALAGVIDSHTHLELCEPPDAELVAAAAEAGVTRIVTVGIDGASCRAALAAAEDFPQVYAAIGRHPNAATGSTTPTSPSSTALAAHPQVRRDRRDRPRLSTATTRRAPTRSARSGPRSSSRARSASRWSSTRARPTTTRWRCCPTRAGGVARDPALLLDARPDRGVPRARGLVDLVRRQRHLPEGDGRCGRRRCESRPSGCWSRPTRRTCRRSPCAASRTSRRNVVHDRAGAGGRAPAWPTRARRGGRGERGRGVRVVSAPPARWPELPGRPQHPRRDRAAGWSSAPTTSCSRSAAGRACCPSGWPRGRAPACGRGRPPARGAAPRRAGGPFDNVTLHIADALELDLAALDPAPTTVVANLPYGDRRDRDPAHDRRAAERAARGW